MEPVDPTPCQDGISPAWLLGAISSASCNLPTGAGLLSQSQHQQLKIREVELQMDITPCHDALLTQFALSLLTESLRRSDIGNCVLSILRSIDAPFPIED